MFVLTMDQRASRRGPDLVPGLLEMLRDIPAKLAFERSVGDEVQGVLTDPGSIVEVVMRALRTGQWYIGIGVGPVDFPLPPSPREASGPAFVAARAAVERAKKTGERVPLSVQWSGGGAASHKSGSSEPGLDSADAVQAGFRRADPQQLAASAEAVLVLTGRLVRGRTEAEWRILDLLQPGVRGGQAAVAERLGISPQAVSKAVLRSGWQEEHAGRAAAAVLLNLVSDTL
ncbi:MarR family transcriptional regulator [Paenarthrobacter sp. PH39-S1]|uniref:MarR family transcriptional regulator n=1 Tax=Paenarthrobacter sp. PH39-S1 TaxID=3046204 RepID=UPI0024BAE9F8|nr:MarR family transcriptional regulator [Paenarthrobacter sp. PH39-S1]MDJ0357251.1 MarR family transcriptional regulator [Paenarthrobacter sp. PH39-S1]